jgi:hypothetical protein
MTPTHFRTRSGPIRRLIEVGIAITTEQSAQPRPALRWPRVANRLKKHAMIATDQNA